MAQFCQGARAPENVYTAVSKNVSPMTCYNIDTHNPITIIFGITVTTNARNQAMLSHLPYLVVLHYLAKQETPKLHLFT